MFLFVMDWLGTPVHFGYSECSASVQYAVADPGPLLLGVLDRWTPTVNVVQTLTGRG